MAAVKFGTSGWRDIIAEGFTFRNVEIVAQAIAEVVKSDGIGAPRVVIGHDERFLSDAFARAAALTLAAEGVKVLLPHRSVPTPVISYMVRTHGLNGAINITASHNPPEYNGIKFNASDGAPASLEATKRIEARAQALMGDETGEPRFPAIRAAQTELVHEQVKAGNIEWYHPYDAYRDHLFTLVNTDILKAAKLRVVTDVLYGAGRGYLPELLREMGCDVSILHGEQNPGFGGRRPDPLGENIQELSERVRETDAILGLAVDGDADRFGIVDHDGSYIHANYVLGLLLDYLVASRGWTGEVVRSVPTSHLLDSVAAHHGLDVYETPTGFKWIGGRMVECPDSFILGGEESNGMTIRGHVPEKDGILACLLIAEMVAAKGQSVSACLGDLFGRVGERVVDRLDLELSDERKTTLLKRLAENPPQNIGGIAVERIERKDGFKFILSDGGYVALRLSGTEPLVRCYLDATSREAMEMLKRGARELVGD